MSYLSTINKASEEHVRGTNNSCTSQLEVEIVRGGGAHSIFGNVELGCKGVTENLHSVEYCMYK